MQNANHNDGVAEEEENDFTQQLSILRNNAPFMFAFHRATLGQRWTTNQVRQVVETLENNKTVNTLHMDLEICTSSSIPCFFSYLRTNPRLEKVAIDYHPHTGIVLGVPDCMPFQEQYHRQIDGILRAILQNPAIKHLSTSQLGYDPQTIFQLLAETKTLTAFDLVIKQGVGDDDDDDDDWGSMQDDRPISQEMALAVAAGMAHNTSLKTITLEALVEDPLHIMMSGIGGSASSIESLSISFETPNTEFGLAIARVLHVSPSLKALEIRVKRPHGDVASHDAWVDQVLYSLRQPCCAQVEKLELRGSVRLDLETSAMSIAHAVSIENHIHNLKVLHLHAVVFGDAKSLCLLFNFVGLKQLEVSHPQFQRADGNNEKCSDYWTELIQRNPKLEKIRVRNSGWDKCSMGIVNGACGHESVQTLEIEHDSSRLTPHCHVDGLVGAQLCQLLQNSPRLQTLTLFGFDIIREGAELLAGSIGMNDHLEQLRLLRCDIQLAELTLLLESLLVNRVLTSFGLGRDVTDRDPADTRNICQTISRVFQGNATLVYFQLPRMPLNVEDMEILVGGLHHNHTIKSIDFTEIIFHENDAPCWDILKNALLPEGPNTLSVSDIRLPVITHDESVNDFLGCLPRMQYIKEVEMLDCIDDHGNGKALLLKAVKEKKNLISFSRQYTYDEIDAASNPIDTEIDFYLKLNRFGRQAVESLNVPTSHWPFILSRAAKEPKDVAALFYFVREYSSQSSSSSAPAASASTTAPATTTTTAATTAEHSSKRAATHPYDAVERALSSKRARQHAPPT